MSKQRLIDANAYCAEMREKQAAAKNWLHTTIDGDEIHVRAEQTMISFIEAKLTMDKQPTIDAIPMDWLDEQIHGYASRLQSTELKALLIVKGLWEKDQEGKS